MQEQLKELHPGHCGPFALCEGPSPSPELEVDRTDKALALRAFTQSQTAVLMTKKPQIKDGQRIRTTTSFDTKHI